MEQTTRGCFGRQIKAKTGSAILFCQHRHGLGLRLTGLFALLLLLTGCPTPAGPETPGETNGPQDPDPGIELAALGPPTVTPLGRIVTRDKDNDHIVTHAYAIHSLMSGTTPYLAGLRLDWIEREAGHDDVVATFPKPGGDGVETVVDPDVFLGVEQWYYERPLDSLYLVGDRVLTSQDSSPMSLISVNVLADDERTSEVSPVAIIIGLPPGEAVSLSHVLWDAGESGDQLAGVDIVPGHDEFISISSPVEIVAPEYDGSDLVALPYDNDPERVRILQEFLGDVGDIAGARAGLRPGVPSIARMVHSYSADSEGD